MPVSATVIGIGRGQLRDVDRDAPAVGHVDERQGDDHRAADFQRLGGQEQVALEIGRVGHDEDAVGPRHPGHATVKDVHGDMLVGALRHQAVRARQIDQVDGPAAVLEPPHLLLDRDAGVVADPRGDPGEGREQRALADVRVAEQGDGERARCHRRWVTDRPPSPGPRPAGGWKAGSP
jgi:hypothetical protein